MRCSSRRFHGCLEELGDALFGFSNSLLAGPGATNGLPVGRGSDAIRAAAIARYESLPAAERALLVNTFLNPNRDIYAERNGKASEYDIAIGRYEKKNGDTFFMNSGESSMEHDVNDSSGTVSAGSVDGKRSLMWVLDFHSHSNDRGPGLSGQDAAYYNRGYQLVFGTQKVSLPLDYSGAFYAQQQVFYGWTKTENYTLTFDEMRNALK